ncbi:alpha/beta hydrolase family protein [Paenibacillus sp. 598K]|uniref:alpha/beta hydrolase family protein n=1 Tax=Paenibacillus sp. 598K TaxID=1117987 RepID=UPI000FFE6956|nr:alpha/beta fold hydrolase [Paenibacillus sp. 598K]
MEEPKVERRRFELQVEPNVLIRGDVYASESDAGTPAGASEPLPVIILVHGFKGFKDWGFFPYTAKRFAALGYVAVTFNFSHNGVAARDFDELQRFGRNTYSREQADLASVVDAVAAGRLPLSERMVREELLLVGHSRGGGNSVIFAADHPDRLRGVVAWNGIGHADLFGPAFREQVLREGVGYVANARTKQEMPIEAVFYEDLDRHRERFDIPARAAEAATPMLFIQGKGDAQRLRDGFEALRAAAPQQRFLELEGADHTFGARHPFTETTDALEQAIAATDAFFREIVGQR